MTTDLPPMWRCGDCPLIIVGDRPDDIAEHQTEHADRLTRMGVHTFNIHDIRKYAAENEGERA